MAYQSGGMQLTYATLARNAIAGMLAFGSNSADVIAPDLCMEGFGYGLGVVRDSTTGKLRLPRATIALITFAGAFVASNVIATLVNGIAITPETYATSSDATLISYAAKIAAMDGVATAVADTGDRSVLVTADTDTAVSITGVLVTLGASQTTATVAKSSSDRYVGQPVYDPEQVAGVGFVTEKDIALARICQGIWVYVTATVKKGQKAYLDVTQPGKYTNVAANNIPTGGEFCTAGVSGDLIIVSENLPQLAI